MPASTLTRFCLLFKEWLLCWILTSRRAVCHFFIKIIGFCESPVVLRATVRHIGGSLRTVARRTAGDSQKPNYLINTVLRLCYLSLSHHSIENLANKLHWILSWPFPHCLPFRPSSLIAPLFPSLSSHSLSVPLLLCHASPSPSISVTFPLRHPPFPSPYLSVTLPLCPIIRPCVPSLRFLLKAPLLVILLSNFCLSHYSHLFLLLSLFPIKPVLSPPLLHPFPFLYLLGCTASLQWPILIHTLKQNENAVPWRKIIFISIAPQWRSVTNF